MPPAPAEAAAGFPVVIVSMPFMDARRPSIQLGLLAEIARGYGFPTRTLHANLDLAARLGPADYALLAEHRGRLVGEWLFSVEAFGDTAPDPEDTFLDRYGDDLKYLAGMRDRLGDIRRDLIPAYLDRLIEDYPWAGTRVVAFSSTFQQNTASFALARRLKQRYPEITTVFGGANFDGVMGPELVRTVDVVDFAVVGEGDAAFPQLLRGLAADTGVEAIPGVVSRGRTGIVATPPAPPVRRLDESPVPDYAEYFTRAERLGLLAPAGQRSVSLPFESARGCWWGAKHHCTFCGLNGSSMAFRAKSAGRVAAELATQARTYRTFRFEAVDNILEPGYLGSLLPALADTGADYDIFYEVKANLSRAQLKTLVRAGVSSIQPGIESLSSNVLRLMRKGVRAGQNINVLRWAQYYGIEVGWNIIWGFPGEAESDYADQAAAVPHLVHLRPPASAGPIWLERFSPLFTGAAPFPVRDRSPEASYRYVYPDGVDLDRVAYFFEYEPDGALPPSVYAPLSAAVEEWRAAWAGERVPVLTYWSAPGFLQIYDGRWPGQEGTYSFEGLLADVYLACSDRPVGAAALVDRFRVPAEALDEILCEFQRRGLMFLDGTQALSLALPAVPGR